MPNQQSKRYYTYGIKLFASLFALLILWSCANIGMPEGGPFDMMPPKLISADPGERATMVSSQRMTLHFDEFVKINGQDKIIISPPQAQQPLITARGKSIHIKLVDSLRPNSTYSIYFDDAIVDNNEDNPLVNFGYMFSTGKTIDSMQMQGLVLSAETLEPVPNALVGAYYEGASDSVALKEAFPFAGKSNKLGKFVIRGLRDSLYIPYALSDQDNDRRFDGSSEGFAFGRIAYRTTKLDSLRTDTIKIDSIVRRDTLYRDSLVTYPYTYYYPNNIVLRYYTPLSKQRGLQRHSRVDSLHLTLEFAEKLHQVPVLKSLDKPQAELKHLYLSGYQDRVATYWLLDKDLISRDSIRFTLSYEKTDSLMKLHQTTDTLTFYKPKHKPEATSKAKDNKHKSASELTLSFSGAKGIKASTPEDSLLLTSSLPLEDLKPELIHLEEARDSVFSPITFKLQADSLNPLVYSLDFKRNYGASYKVRIDSGVLKSVYGHVADSLVFAQTTAKEQELGHLQLNIKGIHQPAYVQLLDKSDVVLMTLQARPDSLSKADSLQKDVPLQVTFKDLKPEDYYIRMYLDLNGDELWTTGDYPTREPEPMYYSPVKYPVKKSFTTSEEWSPLDTPLELQKPKEITKIKPEEQKKTEDKNKEYYKRMNAKKRK